LLKQALAIDPSYAPAASLVGVIRDEQNIAGIAVTDQNIAEALRLARDVIATGGNDAKPWREAAECLSPWPASTRRD
jgi:hypothetical protein